MLIKYKKNCKVKNTARPTQKLKPPLRLLLETDLSTGNDLVVDGGGWRPGESLENVGRSLMDLTVEKKEAEKISVGKRGVRWMKKEK